jgi:hypothetical protein
MQFRPFKSEEEKTRVAYESLQKKVVSQSQPSTPEPETMQVASKNKRGIPSHFTLHISMSTTNRRTPQETSDPKRLLVPVELLEDEMQKQIHVDA